MATTVIPTDVLIQGTARATGGFQAFGRDDMEQEDFAVYPIPLTEFRTWDALATNLPGTSATDDLALTTGTLGTDMPSIQTSDLKAAGATTRYARLQFALPVEYVSGQSVTIRASAGMKTTVADTTATIDFQVYSSDRDTTVSADLCGTAAQSINSLTFSDLDFVLTTTSLTPGTLLDIRVAIAVNDGATVTAVIGCLAQLELLIDVKG